MPPLPLFKHSIVHIPFHLLSRCSLPFLARHSRCAITMRPATVNLPYYVACAIKKCLALGYDQLISRIHDRPSLKNRKIGFNSKQWTAMSAETLPTYTICTSRNPGYGRDFTESVSFWCRIARYVLDYHINLENLVYQEYEGANIKLSGVTSNSCTPGHSGRRRVPKDSSEMILGCPNSIYSQFRLVCLHQGFGSSPPYNRPYPFAWAMHERCWSMLTRILPEKNIREHLEIFVNTCLNTNACRGWHSYYVLFPGTTASSLGDMFQS